MIPKGHLIRLNSNRHLFTLTQASAEAEEVDPGTRQTSLPPQGPCLSLHKLQGLKQAPVYPYADCRAPNRRLFTLTQIAGRQTGACLPLRRLQDTKQAPVYLYADCRTPNRRLFTLTQASAEAGKFFLVPAKLRCPRRGPVYPYAGLCRGRGSRSWYPPNFAAPAEALFGFLVRHFSVSLYMASISAA